MLVDLASGSIDRILVVSQDRLLRRPEQLETLFRLHDRLGIPQIECVSSGPIDVMTASGRAFARIKTVFDKAYSEYIGEKIREQKRDRAMRGLPSGGGYRAFGYQPGGLELVPEEASLIREAVDRFVSGESVRSICRDWNSGHHHYDGASVGSKCDGGDVAEPPNRGSEGVPARDRGFRSLALGYHGI